MKELLQPQEIEVFYIIPALKKHLAIELKTSGLKQKEIAKIFITKEAAISQYLNNKRGNKLEFDKILLKEIKHSSKKIIDNLTYMKEIQHLLRRTKETNEICRIHKSLSKIPGHCNPELIGCF